MIIKRLKRYNDILKKELIYAKCIIKNPKLLKEVYTSLNFDAVLLTDTKFRVPTHLDQSKSVNSESNIQKVNI